jgi:sugar O-acyltransferase (sialic acid O-acetyltransferase NeuD family)
MPEKRLVLLAAGGHGSVLLDALISVGASIEGIVDPGKVIGSKVFGVPVIGGDEWLETVSPSDFTLVNGIGAVPRKQLRRKLFYTWKQRGFSFESIVHSSAKLGRETVVSEGVQVMSGSVLQCRVSVGENAVINTGANVDHDAKIGAHAFIGPGAVLCGEVCIGEHVFVGAGAVVLPGIIIGADSIIGAGAIVTRNVAEGSVMFGNPAMQRGII